jgi:hypothetical protein
MQTYTPFPSMIFQAFEKVSLSSVSDLKIREPMHRSA